MTFAITIGCYRMPDFVELNIAACRDVFGKDVPILLSDDSSPESGAIALLADRCRCAYLKANERMSHFSGDMQAIVNASAFAAHHGADIGIKLSQRLVPVHPGFKEVAERAFADPAIWVVVPGRPPAPQIHSKTGMFYSSFEILTDIVALRPDKITPEMLTTHYRDRVLKGAARMDCLVETTMHALIHGTLEGKHHWTTGPWSEHQMGHPKLFLRKCQSSWSEYAANGARLGVAPGKYDLREWPILEGPHYVGRADVV